MSLRRTIIDKHRCDNIRERVMVDLRGESGDMPRGWSEAGDLRAAVAALAQMAVAGAAQRGRSPRAGVEA